MSSVDTANEAAGTISSDRFVEISYDERHPQQCRSLLGQAAPARAGDVAAQLSRLVERHGARGLPAVRGLPAHGGRRRPERLGQVRTREDASLSLGHPARAESRGANDPLRPPQGPAGVAGRAGRVSLAPAPADRRAGRHRAGVRRAAALPRRDRAEPLRHAQSLPGQCRGRPSPVGDGLSAGEIFRQGRPRGGPGAARTPQRPTGQPPHPRRLQRAHAGLAVVLHVHLLHRPRRQDAAGGARRKRLRSAVAHLPVHADRRGSSHVRRRDRRAADDRGDVRGDGQGGH